jgi:hypothetical protein
MTREYSIHLHGWEERKVFDVLYKNGKGDWGKGDFNNKCKQKERKVSIRIVNLVTGEANWIADEEVIKHKEARN